jgi:hypothetical protein
MKTNLIQLFTLRACPLPKTGVDLGEPMSELAFELELPPPPI